MENLVFGFEILGIGLIVVMVTLFIRALLLICFSKIFTPQEKANKEVRKAADRVAAAISTPESANDVKPEVIAATMGALLFAFDTGEQAFKNPVINQINAIEQQNNMWAQVGRTRLLNLRQDFALLRRGKNR